MSPRTSPYRARKVSSSSGAIPDLDASPARLISTSAGMARRRAADSLDSEWTSSQVSFTVFAFRLCRWPMKCQRNASPYRSCFAARSWARFSPTTWIPASARTAMSSGETYFVAATMVTSGPVSARMRSYRSRTSSASNKAEDAVGSARPARAPLREEEVRVAERAQVEPVDALAPGGTERALGGAPQVQLALVHQARAEAGLERLRHLAADLVAARPDSRADGGRERPFSERSATRLDDPLEQASRRSRAPRRSSGSPPRARASAARSRHSRGRRRGRRGFRAPRGERSPNGAGGSRRHAPDPPLPRRRYDAGSRPRDRAHPRPPYRG